MITGAPQPDRGRLEDLHDDVFRSPGQAFVEHRISGVAFESHFLKFW
jgi:hypothetical protein